MKISLPRFDKTFTFSCFMFFLSVFGIILLMCLGFWQIQRGHEKQKMLEMYAKKNHLQAIYWDAQSKLPSQYQKIQVRGHFLSKVFFLDNQFRNHKFGYDVIHALLLENGWIVLVDRGWFAVNSGRNLSLLELPIFHEKNKELTEIEGMAYYPSKKGFVLGQPFEKINKNLTVIETQNVTLISKLLHKPVYPFIIRETENSLSPFLQQWPIVSMQPARHYAYALQWFGLAMVLFIVIVVLKRKNV